MAGERADVLVVGGGPGGCAAATRLAEAGHDVLLLEKKHYPREKVCGDGLTPRSVKALTDLGMASDLERYHRIVGLRACGFGHTLELPWPEHSVYPDYGLTVPRRILDQDIAAHAEKAGATIWQGCEAKAPAFRDGILEGAEVRLDDGSETRVSARYVVVADGSLSRFGRALGTSRDRSYPMGLAVRGYYKSPRDTDQWMESHLDLFHEGAALPAYGWVFPIADGSINVGAGLLSTFRDFKDVNTTALMDSFVNQLGDAWSITPDDATGKAMGGKLPMGISVRPRAGANWLVIGDAAGAVNPFNGEGIAYAIETAEVAVEIIDRAVRSGDGSVLASYSERLWEMYGPYYRAGRIFAALIGNPKMMELLGSVGMRSQRFMQWVMMVLAHLGDPEDGRLTSRAWFWAEKVAALIPGAH